MTFGHPQAGGEQKHDGRGLDMTMESSAGGERQLVRALDWKGAFWVAAGVPPLVLFSIGGIAGTTGKLAFLVWIISMVMLLLLNGLQLPESFLNFWCLLKGFQHRSGLTRGGLLLA